MKNDWKFVYSEGHSLLMNEAFFLAFTDSRDVPGTFRTIFYENRDGLEICYVPKSELDRVKQEGRKFFNRVYRKKFQKAIEQCANRFIEFNDHVDNLDLKKIDNQKLLGLFKKYVEILIAMLAHYQVSGGRCFPLLEEKIKKILSKQFSAQQLEQKYSLLLTYTDIDILQRADIDLMVMAQQKKIGARELRSYAKKYALLFFNEYDEDKILNFVKDRIQELRKRHANPKDYIKNVTREKELLRIEQDNIMSTIKDPTINELIEFLKEQSRLRLEYKNYFFGAEYMFLELFKEIANRIGIPTEGYMASYRIQDTIAFLVSQKKVPKYQTEARKKLFVLYQSKGKKYFAEGPQAEKLIKSIFPKKSNAPTELKGKIANPGLVKGRARIVLPKNFAQMHQDMLHFKKGEILITTMTQPNMVPLMKQAAAIVTDQGGMTSHAAVVSREFHVPCIVGTYDASRVFKTGDLLEVDATKGIVRKLE